MLFLVAAVAGIIVGGGAGFVGFPLLVASVAEAIAPIRVDDEVARPEALDTFRPPPEAA